MGNSTTTLNQKEAAPVGVSVQRRIGLFSATLIVVANMIGAGVFGITGMLATALPSTPALLMAWAVGGFMALCGALSYGELAARLPRSGGEYHFLSKMYHDALGFSSGFISIVVGFSASIAVNAFLFAQYLTPAQNPWVVKGVAIALVTGLTALHCFNIRYGVRIQNAFALLKIGLILFFIIGGLLFAFFSERAAVVRLIPNEADMKLVFSPLFAFGLVSIFYAYLGWNASVYISGEVKRPHRNVPLSLLFGAGAVTVLYLLLNYVFLAAAPLGELSDKIEIGALAAQNIFGPEAARVLSTLIALALISSTSSMVMAGPRVTETMGEDYPIFRTVTFRKGEGGPVVALGLQWLLAVTMIATSTFWEVLGYIGFTLTIFAGLAVAGVYILRFRNEPHTGYRTWGYPVTPAVFLLISGWMVVQAVLENPFVAVSGLATVLAGFVCYYLTRRASK